MSNYVKGTNYAVKDTLSSGDPNKLVKGTELNSEFDAIAVAVATKADSASPSFTGIVQLTNATVVGGTINCGSY